MNDPVTEFIRLDAEINESDMAAEEAAMRAEQARWAQAQVAYEATTGTLSLSQREFADQVGKSPTHIGNLVRLWKKWSDEHHRVPDLRFADAYATAKTSSDDLLAAGTYRGRQADRRVPRQHEDRVQMATTLMADPTVAKAVVAKPSQAADVTRQEVSKRNARDRKRATEQRVRDDEASAMPFPAHLMKITTKVTEWAIELAGLYPDYAELPHGNDGVQRAMAELVEQAQRWIDAHDEADDVIDGNVTDIRDRGALTA